ncbi:MAG: peptidoglycan binding domain-containing protein, partial [Acidimicrobiia bacterium]
MTHQLRRWIIIGAVAAVVLLPVLLFAIDGARTSGEIARNVSAAGVQLGGLGEEDAIAALREYETELANTPAIFTVANTQFTLIPATIGLNIDEQAIVTEAMQQRRDKGFPGSFFSWFGSFGDHIELDIPVTIDSELLDEVLSEWQTKAIAMPAYDGGIIVEDTRILPDYPRPGEGIDRDQAYQEVLASVESIDRSPVTLETTQLQPELTRDDIDAATTEAARLIDEPVTLASDDPEVSITFAREELANALVSKVTKDSPVRLEVSFDQAKIESLLAPHKSEIEQPARDAQFLINEDTREVSLLPSRDATLMDAGLVTDALEKAAASSTNSGVFPFGKGA